MAAAAVKQPLLDADAKQPGVLHVAAAAGAGGGAVDKPKRRLRVLFPLPDEGFDTTECAVAWHMLTAAGHECVFATEKGPAGPPAQCDPKLLVGVLCGQLGAEREPIAFYKAMTADALYRAPVSWASLQDQKVLESFDGLWLTGGHAPQMRQYLGSALLQQRVAAFWALERPVAAICHGPVLLARAMGGDGKSVLHRVRTMCLPKYMEQAAYWVTSWWLGSYYRTYPAYVEDEIKAVLSDPDAQYKRGPKGCCGGPPPKGTATDDTHALVEVDGVYCSARWPGDAYLLARTFLGLLQKRALLTPSTPAPAPAPAASDFKG